MAGQDIKKRLLPGQPQPVNVAGDYIYMKFADRPVNVIMSGGRNGQTRVTMEAGDKYRPGPFTQFEVENPDTENPAQIIMTVGEGDYNRQIVQGEVSVTPVLRAADGSTRADTRNTIAINLAPSNLALTTYAKNDVIAVAADPVNADGGVIASAALVCRGPSDRLTVFDFINDGGGNYRRHFIQFDSEMREVSREVYNTTGQASLAAMTYRPGVGYLFIDTLSNPNRVVRETGTGLEVLKQLTENATAICWMPERQQYAIGLTVNGGVDIYDANFGFLFNVPAGTASDALGYDAANDYLIVGRGGSAARLVNFSGVDKGTLGLPDIAGTLTTGNGIFTVDGLNYYTNASRGTFNGTNNPILVKAAAVDYTTKPEFVARRPGCELAGSMIRPQRVPQVTATITAQALPEGVALTGEVIKAAIEYYFKRAAPDDYLDHVYYLDASRDENGVPFKPVSSGNQTFDRANIADDFGVLTPAQIVLTIDNELKLGSAI